MKTLVIDDELVSRTKMEEIIMVTCRTDKDTVKTRMDESLALFR